ncbi:MAG: hypothetical protein COV30_00400 [Candidatus Yanofskybacteria bacterium CG10_big_fil_rev_8_21_14_0_10_37_15]|uniref:Uncharacterized protein n=1 Tax=Candidatus Yanofskybacteria bacterium CG10_big_fil_rev_8_21_14_0_10_37_15 TaxID=1975097 RepID=A0A2H0R6B7_9BACT|nr:MAG: hypothetical protein COV30_00400 [Candidatus Yanofskybacteria bacterium CG10_big_fil_rev_8_21_14_0_10_37_15]
MVRRIKNFLKLLFVFIGVWVAALIPLWFFLVARFFLNPFGYWENLVLTMAFLYFLGLLQLVLFLIAAWITYCLWSDFFFLRAK